MSWTIQIPQFYICSLCHISDCDGPVGESLTHHQIQNWAWIDHALHGMRTGGLILARKQTNICIKKYQNYTHTTANFYQHWLQWCIPRICDFLSSIPVNFTTLSFKAAYMSQSSRTFWKSPCLTNTKCNTNTLWRLRWLLNPSCKWVAN